VSRSRSRSGRGSGTGARQERERERERGRERERERRQRQRQQQQQQQQRQRQQWQQQQTRARFPGEQQEPHKSTQEHTRSRFLDSPGCLPRRSAPPPQDPGPPHMVVVCARGACAHSANTAPHGGPQGAPAGRRERVPGAQATREPRARRGAVKPGEAADRPCHLACVARAGVARGLRGHLRPPQRMHLEARQLLPASAANLAPR